MLIKNLYSACLHDGQEYIDKDLQRNNAFLLHDQYGHTLTQEPHPGGVMKFTTLPLQLPHTKFGKDWPSSF